MNAVANHTQQAPNAAPPASPAEDKEWLEQLKLITDRLQLLYNSPLIAHDAIAKTIFRDLAFAPDMEEISRLCDLLGVRVNELINEMQTSSIIDSSNTLETSGPSRVFLTL